MIAESRIPASPSMNKRLAGSGGGSRRSFLPQPVSHQPSGTGTAAQRRTSVSPIRYKPHIILLFIFTKKFYFIIEIVILRNYTWICVNLIFI
jgi:hypothetical protein